MNAGTRVFSKAQSQRSQMGLAIIMDHKIKNSALRAYAKQRGKIVHLGVGRVREKEEGKNNKTIHNKHSISDIQK